MLIPSDVRIFSWIGLALLVFILATWLVARWFGIRPSRAMTTAEWRIAFKLVGIVLLALVLYQASITFDFPAESFIYGRF